MSTCRGVDVSAHQGPQDWAAHKRDGVVFAFAKASEGQHSRDGRFAAHITAIKAAGLVPGAYHFAWPNQDAAVEAANYIDAVRPYADRGFTHWLDLERYSDGRNYRGRSAGQIRAWAGAWIAAVQKTFPGQRVGVYTSGDDLAAGHLPPGVPLWYPAYPWSPAPYSRAEAAPRPTPSGHQVLIWQFTSQPIDRSICYLSADALRAWAAGTTPTDEEDGMATRTDKEIAAAVWETDGVLGVPESWRTGNPGNKEWKAASVLVSIGDTARRIETRVTAQTAAIRALADALAARDTRGRRRCAGVPDRGGDRARHRPARSGGGGPVNMRFVLDLAERAGWTGVQAALGLVAVELADLPVWWAAPVALLAASAKSWAARHIGRAGTASTLPAHADPASGASG